MTDKFLTSQQAAKALGLAHRTVLKYIERGKIKAHKFGRDWQIDAAEVERYRRERKPVGRPKKESE